MTNALDSLIYTTYEEVEEGDLIEEGMHTAKCVDVLVYDKQEKKFGTDEMVINSKVQYVFEIADGSRAKTKPFNNKWGAKSSHFKFVSPWFGGLVPSPYQPAKHAIGRAAKILVTHTQGTSRVFVDVASAKPVKGGKEEESGVPF